MLPAALECWRSMRLLLALVPLVWVAFAQFSTVQYRLYKSGMMVMNPLVQLQLPSSVSCAIHCEMYIDSNFILTRANVVLLETRLFSFSRNGTCYTFSVTPNAGSVTCRLSKWNPKLTSDSGSQYFVGPIPQSNILGFPTFLSAKPQLEVKLKSPHIIIMTEMQFPSGVEFPR